MIAYVLRRVLIGVAQASLTLWSPSLWAHERAASGDGYGWNLNLNPLLLALLATALGLYALGLLRLWRRSRLGRGGRIWQVMSYGAGLLVVTVALVSPLDGLANELGAAHMVQHVMLIAVAAPLLVMATPLPVVLWAFPASLRRQLRGAGFVWISQAWKFLTTPFVAWGLHATVLWLWHAPALYQAALRDPLVHDLEHTTFFGTALLFWYAVLRGGGKRSGPAAAIGLLFTTTVHSGVLAALMTFSREPWYPAYAQTTARWGFTPLEDQQLAGLIMWVPTGFLYLLASLILLAVWFSDGARSNLPHAHRVRGRISKPASAAGES